MKNSIKDLKGLLSKEEQLSTEKQATVTGGCGTISDPRRCESFMDFLTYVNGIITKYK